MVDDHPSNPTTNVRIADVIDERISLSRRTVLGGSLAAAAMAFVGTTPAVAGAASRAASDARRGRSLLGFAPVDLGYGDAIVVPDGYSTTPFLAWGTPILPGADAGTLPTTGADAALRMGGGHDGMWFFPTDRSGTEGVLCINFEFTRNDALTRIPGAPALGTADFVALSKASHGVGVIQIRRTEAGWEPVIGDRNRRITPDTPVEFSGPVAGTKHLANTAGNPFAGTVNNCANGSTPWGTYLTCEENFNGYFNATGAFEPTEAQSRYGFSAGGFGYAWGDHDPRFDLSDPAHANEGNRFGWVVEIDPMDPTAPPVKRTALGRIKHESVEIVEGQGRRIVAYMGDDQADDYFYKFVSTQNWRSLRARGRSPLDEGTLYVARFHAAGNGEWLELSMDNPVLAGMFADTADLLVNTRLAADAVGATPMDRPEWVASDPRTGDVFFTCTNNSGREVANVANPRTPNPSGHIIRISDADRHVGTVFNWSVFLIAGDPDDADEFSNGVGPTIDPQDKFSDPDGLWFDRDGRMYIQTDGGQPDGANDQMLLADPATGDLRRFLTGVPDCEITGITGPPDGKTLFVNVQHPGDGDPTVSNFPDGGDAIPRDSIVVITKDDGGTIGS